jgi:hypothetical protein
MRRPAAPLALWMSVALALVLGGSAGSCGDDDGDRDGTAGDGAAADGAPGDGGATRDGSAETCAPSGGCDSVPSCVHTCCAPGEACVDGECRCGGSPACEEGLTCAAAGPVEEGSCGVICCGEGVPCPK